MRVAPDMSAASVISGGTVRKPLIVIDSAELLIENNPHFRKNGYAISNQEFIEEMTVLGVPILGANGMFVTTLSFHAPVHRVIMAELS